ncbi:hypothetical protein HDU67_005410, partial [Dinochytrium kinnereticum]
MQPVSPRTPRSPKPPHQPTSRERLDVRGVESSRPRSSSRSNLANHRTISASLEELVTIATHEATDATTYEHQAFQSHYTSVTSPQINRQEMESMQRDLRIACEVGQQLLKRNEEIRAAFLEAEEARERLERALEEERLAAREGEEIHRSAVAEKERMGVEMRRLEDQVVKLRAEVRKTADVHDEA